MTKTLSALFIICVGAASAMPPPSHGVEAKTPEEFDLYLEFHEATAAVAKHELALRFEKAYPESDLLIYVYESEFEYARARDQRDFALATAEKLLRLAPNSMKAFLGLSEVLPHGAHDATTLAQAEQYARKALAGAKELQLSREITRSDCDTIRTSLLSRAHAALGYVLGKRGDVDASIKELELAIALSPRPVGSQLLLAGKLYRTANREQDAIEMFRRAAKVGPADVTSLAEAELRPAP